MLTGEVNDKQARRVTERLFALASQNAKPITFVISSPGGHVESGDMIHDVVKFIDAPVRMLGTGWVASAGALIYCSAPRDAALLPAEHPLPAARTARRRRRHGFSDVEIQAREILRMRERLNKIFADATRSAGREDQEGRRPRLLDARQRSERLRPRRPHRE